MSVYENSLQLIGQTLDFNSSKFIKKLIEIFSTYGNDEAVIVRKLCIALKKSGAVIAGGSVLSAFTDFELNDIDIYVNLYKAEIIHEFLIEIGYKLIKSNTCIAPAYDESFFKKNNISARFYYENRIYVPIDLMIISNNIQVENVVRNFDLSFCEIWFDGQNVYAVDPDGINQKKGILKPDYLESLFVYHNEFIKKRIKKYLKRGFEINYSRNPCTFLAPKIQIKEIKKPNGSVTFTEPDGTIVYPEEWVVKKVYSTFILDHVLYDDSNDNNMNVLFDSIMTTKFTVEILFDMLIEYYNIIVDSDNYTNITTRKVNLLIKYYIKPFKYIEQDSKWMNYINLVLNKELSADSRDEYFVDFNYKEDDYLKMPEFLFGTIESDQLSVYNDYDMYEKYRKDFMLFYNQFNQISSLKEVKNYFIQNNDSINEHLRDPNNFIFISRIESNFEVYKLTRYDLYQMISDTIIVSRNCKKLYMNIQIVFGEELLDECVISLPKINAIKYELENPNGKRVFYLTKSEFIECDESGQCFPNAPLIYTCNRDFFEVYDEVYIVNDIDNYLGSELHDMVIPTEDENVIIDYETLFPGVNREMFDNIFGGSIPITFIDSSPIVENVRRRLSYEEDDEENDEENDEEDDEDEEDEEDEDEEEEDEDEEDSEYEAPIIDLTIVRRRRYYNQSVSMFSPGIIDDFYSSLNLNAFRTNEELRVRTIQILKLFYIRNNKFINSETFKIIRRFEEGTNVSQEEFSLLLKLIYVTCVRSNLLKYYYIKYGDEEISDIMVNLDNKWYLWYNNNIFLTEVQIRHIILNTIRDANYSQRYIDEIEDNDDNEYELEDIDITRLPENCFDFSMYGEENITGYLNDDPDAFVFVMMDLENNIGEVFCFSKENLRAIINDEDKWLYECGGPYIRNTQDRSMGAGIINFPYIKIPIDREGGLNAFIPLYQLKHILSNNDDKVYCIVPMMIGGDQKMITHTINRKLYLGRNITQTDFFGANHCQHGSNILIYEIRIGRHETDEDSDEGDDIRIKMLLNKD